MSTPGSNQATGAVPPPNQNPPSEPSPPGGQNPPARPVPVINPNVTFFRRGELTLLFEGPVRDAKALNLDPLVTDLNNRLSSTHVTVHSTGAFTGPGGSPRVPILLNRGNNQVPGALVTLNLDSWITEEERRTADAGNDYAGLSKGLTQVRDAVNLLNDQLYGKAPGGTIIWEGLQATAVSPNWLVTPFDCF